jgi:hypothetical protein
MITFSSHSDMGCESLCEPLWEYHGCQHTSYMSVCQVAAPSLLLGQLLTCCGVQSCKQEMFAAALTHGYLRVGSTALRLPVPATHLQLRQLVPTRLHLLM